MYIGFIFKKKNYLPSLKKSFNDKYTIVQKYIYQQTGIKYVTGPLCMYQKIAEF